MNKKAAFIFLGVCLVLVFYQNLLLASSANPIEGIKNHVDTTITSIVSVVQVLGILALASFVSYSWWTGNFDKGRFILIITGFVILAAAKPIITFVATWVK